MFRPLHTVRLLCIALVAVLAAVPLSAQIPDTFENLTILPKDTSKDDLVGAMRGMAGALGVRCSHCHAGEEGQPLSSFDFASDAKPAKDTARVMMRMVGEINGKLLPRIGKERSELLAVNCMTCHHHQARPLTMDQVLTDVLETEGIDAAMARYRELRERYYGRNVYDFGERALLGLAGDLADQENYEATGDFLELNLEFYPDSARTYAFLGQYYSRTGDRPKARQSFEKAIELDPKFGPRLAPQLEELAKK